MENTNINKIVDYFNKGCKNDFKLGLELEHIIVDKATRKSIDYYGDKGIEKLLESLKPQFDEEVISNGHLIGLSKSDYYITLEPGAQLEISIKQQRDIKDIEKIYNDFYGTLSPVLDKMGYELINLGYQPVSKVEDIKLLPKDRYKCMDFHFTKSGKCGKNMMRGTAATQVSIDYKNEKDFIIKYRAAMLMGPIFAFITDNSPVFEGEPYKKNMLRQYIWQNVDKDRTDFKPDLKSFGFNDYAGFVYNVPQIIYMDGNKTVYTDKTAGELYKDKTLTAEEIELILSMVFPDVRLKRFIEIRMADSMPIKYVLSYASLIKGIFMNSDLLDKFIKQLHYSNYADIEAAKTDLSNHGYLSEVYGYNVYTLIDNMLQLAQSNLNAMEAGYLNELKDLIEGKKTLAQLYKEKELLCRI